MAKDFGKWHERKRKIEDKVRPDFYHEREIWWCSLGENIGFEQDGKGDDFIRPVLILKGFNKEILLCVALIGRKKQGKYYMYLGKINGKDSTVVLSQVRLVDSKRLMKKMDVLNPTTFKEVRVALQRLIFG